MSNYTDELESVRCVFAARVMEVTAVQLKAQTFCFTLILAELHLPNSSL